MSSPTDADSPEALATLHGGELYDPVAHDDLGEPDEEQAFEDVIGEDK